MHAVTSILIAFSIFSVFGCAKMKLVQEESKYLPKSMKYNELREFDVNGLKVMFKKVESDTFYSSLYLLNYFNAEDGTLNVYGELILRATMLSNEAVSAILIDGSSPYVALSIESIDSSFENIFDEMIGIFYNQSFDSSYVQAAVAEINADRDSVVSFIPTSEDLQRYHADNFVTSRMLLFIEGDFSFDRIQNSVERSFDDKTIGLIPENDLRDLIDPRSRNITDN